MESSNTSNQFQDYITKLFTPSCIVYSTEDVKKSIRKNNLSPAEFLRPFGNFSGYNINFSFGDKFTINIKNFRIDFHDSHKFRNYNNNLFNEALDLVLAYNAPDWDYKQLNLTNRAFLELFKKKLKNYSTSWFDEYEKLICESLRFNVYEMFQQPLANIYVASAHDEVETIELLKKKNIPSLLSDNIYEHKLASMILLLNDLSEKRVSNEKLISKINIIKNKNPRTLVMFLDINSQDMADNESKLDDIWLPYLHKTDIYNSNFINCDRGKFISLNEREIFKTSIFNFFDDYVKSYLQKLMLDLDEEVSNNKKGIKNGLLSIFKKSEKPEFINYEGNSIYKLTSLEKKIYLLSIIQFYLRDYENCYENLRLLQNDLKGKSTEHFNSINELLNIVKFLNGKRDIDFDSVYTAYKKQNLKIAFRFLIIYIRMLEASKKFNEITKILVKFVNEIPLSYITPLLLEKLAIAHLYSAPVNIRKFCLYQALTAIAFRNTKTDMKKYVLNNFGNVVKFFLKNSASFVKIKEYINLTVADICLNSNKFDGGQIFYRNYLELSANKNSDQEQDYIINHYLKCIASANSAHMDKLLYVPLNYFSIPEVINTSLIVIHEQDQENCNGRNWRNFKQFSKVKERIWANLTENDMNVINNLDNIIEGKQNFTNQQVFKCATNNKIIVKFVIKNPLNLLLNVSKLKLICDFVPKDNSVLKPPAAKYENMNGNAISSNEDDEENKTENECIIYDEKSVNLDRFEEKLIDLYCIPKKPGQLIIRGLEIGLFKMALFNHSFYEKTPNDLYKQKDNYIRSKPKHILYDVTDEKQDISIKFSNKDLTLFKNELFFLKIKIQNNSNAKLKRYSVFLDDNDNDLHIKIDNKSSNNNINSKRGSKGFHSSSFSSHSHMSGLDNISQQQPNFYHEEKPIIGNVSIFKYFHREVDVFKNDSNEIAIPLCPQYEGEFKLKVLIKFEEESKFKEIEIRRFLLKVKVIPSVNLSYAQEILNFNRNKIDLSLNFNYHLYNTFDLSNLKIGKIFTNEFLVKSEENINWITLANEKYSKLYSQIKLKYDIEEEKIKQEQLAIEEKKAKKLSRIISNEKNPFENIDIREKDLYLFDFVLFYSELQNEKNGINQSALENLIGAAGDNLAKLSDISADAINNKDLDYNKNFTSAAQKAEANRLNLMSLYEISLKFKELLNKKKNVFISYSITDKTNNYEFQGLNMLSLTINPQSLNYKKIKNIIKEISEVQVSTEKLTNSLESQVDGGAIKTEVNSNITFVNVKIKMKNLFQHLELSCFEIFVHDEDNEFDWLGIKKYKIKEDGNYNSNSNEKDFVNEFDFNFSTNKKGTININRFNINIIPNLNPDKVITISYIPHPIILDL